MAVLEEGEVRDMAELKVYKCDMCPSIKKGDEDGWFRALADTRAPATVIVSAWTTEPLDAEDYPSVHPDTPEMHLCSESCVAKLVSRTVGAGAQTEELRQVEP